MPLTKQQLKDLPSPYYRVAVKALIFDDQNRLLMAWNDEGNPEVPGGGWEYDESLEDCLRREILEEVGVSVQEISPIEFTYRARSKRGYMALRLVVRAKITSDDFKPTGDMIQARFVTKQELLDFTYIDPADAVIVEYVDRIWPKE